MTQWRKQTHGWLFMATVGQAGGLGIVRNGRWNGWSIFLGPLAIDIQPPLPRWMQDQIEATKIK